MGDNHFYQRTVDPQGDDSLARLARWVIPGATVLELGPGSGYFTRYLTESMGCAVDTIERDLAMAEHVRPWCRSLTIADLDEWALDIETGSERYPFVIVADVLEHLRYPDVLLRKIKKILTPDGRVLISVPNIAYAGLIADLARGEFSYRDEGLLDRTHIHFFTKNSLTSMLEASGLYVWSCEGVSKPLSESEFSARAERLSTAMRGVISEMEHACCYQWLVDARLVAPLEPVVTAKTGEDANPVRVFWSDKEAPFSYENSAVSWVTIGDVQVVEFSLPVMACGRVRLRLADRAGYIHLRALSLAYQSGEGYWSWSAAQGVQALRGDTMGVVLYDDPASKDGADALAVLHDSDTWFELPIKVENAEPLLLNVELSWSMSADYLAAKHGWEQAILQKQKELDSIKKVIEERDRQIENLLISNAQAWQALDEANALLQKVRGVEAELNKTKELLVYRASWRGWLRFPFSVMKGCCRSRRAP